MRHSSRERRSAISAAVVALSLLGFAAPTTSAQDLSFRTLAGKSPAGNSDGDSLRARFNGPTSVAVDGTGTLYVADQQNCAIRQVSGPLGTVTTFAGGTRGNAPCGAADGTRAEAQFKFPTGVAIDLAGEVYVADTNNHTIRRITPTGLVTTVAGLAGSPGAANGTGSAARFNNPTGVAVDSAGTVYIADTDNHTIRQITSAGVVTTVAGTAGSPGSADGTGSAARFNSPRGIAVDKSGNLYVADSNNHTIRKIVAGGIVTTLAGTAGMSGFMNATGSAAQFFNPRGIAVDAGGTLYVADTNNQRIRRIAADGIVTTFAGSGLVGGFGDDSADARFNNPEGVAVDAAGVVYVADTATDAIRKIANGFVTHIAGFSASLGSYDGLEQMAQFAHPSAVAVDLHTGLWCLPVGGLRLNSLYVADRDNNTIREITLPGHLSETTSGRVSTLAGLAEHPGSADGPGSTARFNSPRAVAVDNSVCGTDDHIGAVYVADGANHTIRMIRSGVVTTVAGLAESPGSTDGGGSDARFNQPSGIAVDNTTGIVYVADSSNHTIRKIEHGGIVTTVAGLAGASGGTDGVGSAARFNSPTGLAVDATGIVYIADTNNHTIRRMTPAGVVTTLAGLAGAPGADDGSGAAARFNNPHGIALDPAGSTIYVADTDNHTIRRITADNEVTTIAGRALSYGGENDGRFNTPEGIAVDSRGFLYVADTRNNQIQATLPLDTSVFADVGPGYGIWLRRGATWQQVHSRTAKALMVIDSGSDDSLIVDFGPGVGIWFYHSDGSGVPSSPSWVQIHSLSADAMAGIDSDGDADIDRVVFSFAGAGLWLFNRDTNGWTQLHSMNPIHLAAGNLDGSGGDELIADFAGFGLWVYSAGAWSQLHRSDVSTMMTADLDGNGKQDLIATFPGFGIWAYMNRTVWVQIHALSAQRMASADLDGNGLSDLIIDFGAGVGLWARINSTTWQQLHGLTTESIVAGDLDGDGVDELIADFGARGVWVFSENESWTSLIGVDPKSIATGRLR